MSPVSLRRGVRIGLVVLLASTQVAACAGFTARNERARRIVDAPRLLGERATFSGLLVVTARLVDGEGLSASAKQEAKAVETRRVQLRVDLADDLADATPAGAVAPTRVFHNFAMYGRRPDARPEDARPWVRVNIGRVSDTTTLDPQDHAPIAGADVLSPVLLVDLLSGALAGSVREQGAEAGGVQRFAANVDVSKAIRKASRRDFSDRERQDLLDLLETLGVREDALHRLEVWIGTDGLPQRLTLVLREEPFTRVRYEVAFDLTLTKVGEPVTIDRPTLEEQVTVASVSQYLTALAPPAPTAGTS